MPILIINAVAETKSDMTSEWKSHVKVHSCSVNAGQSHSTDQGVVEEENLEA